VFLNPFLPYKQHVVAVVVVSFLISVAVVVAVVIFSPPADSSADKARVDCCPCR
jgi:hypothetical protein